MPESKPNPEECRFTCGWQCGICSTVCRVGAVSHSSGAFRIDLTICTRCKTCSKVCPAAIIPEAFFE